MRKYSIGDKFKSGRLICEIMGYVPDSYDGIFRYRMAFYDLAGETRNSDWTEVGITTKMTPIKIQKKVGNHFQEDLFTI